jgi:multicomponent Na+:H+ antiporter subunit D
MCVKAALFPVYDWLPRAHTAAPAYISALLSGLLVKTGIYGLIRFIDIYNVPEIFPLIFWLGFFTALSGIVFAVAQKDIKGILAFHTISQIGLIIMSISMNSETGMVGAYMHIFNHFLFKSLLFLGAGIIINEYGKRRVTEIRGVATAHPILSLCMFSAVLAITGAPLFVGFLSKTMMKLSMSNDLYLLLFQVVSVGTIISFLKFSKIFIGVPEKRNRLNRTQMTAMVVLTVIMIATFIYQPVLIEKIYTINSEVATGLHKNVDYLKHALYDGKYLVDYLTLILIGLFLYKLLVNPNNRFWHFIRHFKVKFQDAMISLISFTILVLILI